MTVVVCVILADWAVTVTVKFLNGVAAVDTVRIEVAFASDLSLKLVGLSETLGPVPFPPNTLADKLITPVNPPMLVRIRLERPVPPGEMTSWFGIGLIAKSLG